MPDKPDGSSHRGRLVTIEGIDGCGKSVLAKELVTLLRKRDLPTLLVSRKTVSDTVSGFMSTHLADLAHLIWEYPESARTSDLGFDHWAHLLAAWYYVVDHVVVRPGIAKGRVVIVDAWFYKYVARFAVDMDVTEALGFFSGITVPDQVVWLDLPPELCATRREQFRPTERGEWAGKDGEIAGFVEYQSRVRTQFSKLAVTGRWHVENEPRDPECLAYRVSNELTREWTAEA